jgi:NAD+ diphosphatase
VLPFLPAALQALAHRYGEPRLCTVDVGANGYLATRKRTAEVCMVVQTPSAQVFTMTKAFYPPGCYRLPTGGMRRHEPVLPALQRETLEEFGQALVVRRFLAAVAYNRHTAPPAFYTFAFLLDGSAEPPRPRDRSERITGFRAIPVDELPGVADALERLPLTPSTDVDVRWRDWGRFRAVIHRVVWQALSGSSAG